MSLQLEEPPRSSISSALADPVVRGCVTETVRRRVPGEDASDVAQAVFCDALESRTVPRNALEIPLWLVGVARNVATDYFRRRPRERGDDSLEACCDPPRFEVREAITRVLESLGDSAKKTLLWMVLEQEGVELRTIAREEKLSATAVRARVYRLRRILRRELAYLLCCVALVLAGAHILHRPTESSSTATGPTLPSWLLGDHDVTQLDLAADVDGVVRAALSHVTTLSVGPSLVAVGPVRLRVERVVSSPGADGDLEVTLVDGKGKSEVVVVHRSPDGEAAVTATSGRVRGRIVLAPSR